MAGFIEDTIASVLSQNYPHIEYIVVDGGSTDGTLDILRRYEGKLRFVSESDSGPAQAINRGFRMSSGAIFGWLNADDTYLPGAIRAAVEYLMTHPQTDAVYGDAYWTGVDGHVIAPYPTREFDKELLRQECFICQPACFMRRSLFGDVLLDPCLKDAFDYDLWIRAANQGRFERLQQPLATSRMHRGNRTLGQRRRIFRCSFAVLQKHYGYIPFRWIHAYCSYLLDQRDQFYDPLNPTFFKYLVSLPTGCRENRKELKRYWREWLSVMNAPGFLRLARARCGAMLRRLRRSPRPPKPSSGW